jgi:hypothetical protein
MFLFLAHRTPLYTPSRMTSFLSLSRHPFSPTGPLNSPPSCLSKVKLIKLRRRRTVPPKSYQRHRAHRAHPLKTPVPSTIASGVVCQERRDSGSAGSGVHVPLSSLLVSLRLTSSTDGYMRECSTHFSQRRAQSFGCLHSSCLGIPFPRMDTWAYLCTYVIALCRPFLRSQNPLLVCFLAIVSLENMFDFGGEQLAMYCGPDLGDLIIITLNKYVRLISS